jgi:hypothetical protein
LNGQRQVVYRDWPKVPFAISAPPGSDDHAVMRLNADAMRETAPLTTGKIISISFNYSPASATETELFIDLCSYFTTKRKQSKPL